jgi:hypothetical protein
VQFGAFRLHSDDPKSVLVLASHRTVTSQVLSEELLRIACPQTTLVGRSIYMPDFCRRGRGSADGVCTTHGLGPKMSESYCSMRRRGSEGIRERD